LSGGLETGLGAAGMRSPTKAVPKEELPIRRPKISKETPYRAGGSAQESVPVRITDELPIRQADKLAKDPYEFAGESIETPEVKHRDFGYDFKPSPEEPQVKQPFVNPFEKPAVTEEAPKHIEEPQIKQPTVEDKLYNLASEK